MSDFFLFNDGILEDKPKTLDSKDNGEQKENVVIADIPKYISKKESQDDNRPTFNLNDIFQNSSNSSEDENDENSKEIEATHSDSHSEESYPNFDIVEDDVIHSEDNGIDSGLEEDVQDILTSKSNYIESPTVPYENTYINCTSPITPKTPCPEDSSFPHGNSSVSSSSVLDIPGTVRSPIDMDEGIYSDMNRKPSITDEDTVEHTLLLDEEHMPENTITDLTHSDNDIISISSSPTEDMQPLADDHVPSEIENDDDVDNNINPLDMALTEQYFLRSQASMICHICKKPGHKAIDCPLKQSKQCCFLCGEPGHESKRCPHRICNKCHCVGHNASSCKNTNSHKYCYTCGSKLHSSKECPLHSSLSSPDSLSLVHCVYCHALGHFNCQQTPKEPSNNLGKCAKCGSKDHHTIYCHLNQHGNKSQSSKVQCFFCGEMGHVKADYVNNYKNKKNTSKKTTASSKRRPVVYPNGDRACPPIFRFSSKNKSNSNRNTKYHGNKRTI
ncbi:hypothetical protein WA158_003226 [Blastocystis sp. Blastoise]